MKETLRGIIAQIESLQWDHVLYVDSFELELETPVAVTEDDGVSDSFGGLQYYLPVQDVQSIVENLQVQVARPDEHQILQAIKYYHEYDAFIRIESNIDGQNGSLK